MTNAAKKTKPKKLPSFHVKKGDTVMVISGKDKGKTGLVKKILRNRHKVLVEGVNIAKKAVRPNPMVGQQGGLVEVEMPLHASKVMLYDLKANQATRIKKEEIKGPDGKTKRVRVSKKTGEQLDV